MHVIPRVALLEPEDVADPLRVLVVPPKQQHVVLVELDAGRLSEGVHPVSSIIHRSSTTPSDTRPTAGRQNGRRDASAADLWKRGGGRFQSLAMVIYGCVTSLGRSAEKNATKHVERQTTYD